MAGTTGDVIQLTDIQSYLGQEVLNIYYYILDDTGTAGYLDGILAEFDAAVVDDILPIQHQLLTHTALKAENIFSGDLLELPYATPRAGTRASATSIDNATPSYVAAVFSFKRQNSRVRNGRKSIGGLYEGDVSGNSISSLATALNTAAGAMEQDLFPGGVDLFHPAIIGRVPYTTPGGNPAFRLPVSQVEMDDNFSLVDQVQASYVVSTMNTRKVGRGS